MSLDVFASQKICPLCGSDERRATTKGLRRDKIPGYLQAVAQGIGIKVESITETLHDWECNSCRCIFVDPRLSIEVLNRLFLVNAPIHNAGWAAFTKKILDEPSSEKYLGAVKRFLHNENIEIGKYLEVGCPFGGLALDLASPSQVVAGLSSSPGLRETYSGQSRRRILRYAINSESVRKRLQLALIRGWLRIHKARRFRSGPKIDDSLTLGDVSFLNEFSMNRWSPGCSAYGQSCITTAHLSLKAKVVSVGGLSDLPDLHFDLVGIFNSLDHSDSPMQLLQLVSKKAKNVIVTVHRLSDAYLQHRFAFGDETIPRICEKLELQCRDLSNELGDSAESWLAYLISAPS